MVPRGGIEPPTQGFSGLCSTTELPRQGLIFITNKKVKGKLFFYIHS